MTQHSGEFGTPRVGCGRPVGKAGTGYGTPVYCGSPLGSLCHQCKSSEGSGLPSQGSPADGFTSGPGPSLEHTRWTVVADRDVDTRRRLSLRGVGNPEHTRYRATTDPLGQILLVPVVSIPAADFEAMREGSFGG